MIKSNIFYLILTFDTDADIFDESLSNAQGSQKKPLSFDSVLSGIPIIVEKTVSDLNDLGVFTNNLTWMVRVDDEIAYHFGDPCFLLKSMDSFFRTRIQSGDEVGFHPHLYHIDINGQIKRI